MKAKSIWQPYASLIMCGAMTFETSIRAVPAALIGQRIAIHAAKHKPIIGYEALKRIEHFLKIHRLQQAAGLPKGVILGTAVCSGSYRCGQMIVGRNGQMAEIVQTIPGSADIGDFIPMDHFGDYSAERWAWSLTDIRALPEPIPVRGHGGWWNWISADEGSL